MQLSVVIPAYKEEPYIGKTLASLHDFLKKHSLLESTEVIVVAADGNDNTASIAAEYSKKFSRLLVIQPGPKVGKGRDLTLGFKRATGDYQVFMDADMATPMYHLESLLDTLVAGADMVIGARNLDKMHSSRIREISSKLSNAVISLLIVPGFPDTQCGFKGFTRSAADIIFSRSTVQGWGIDFEMLEIANKHNLDIQQIYIPDWKDPKGDNGLAGESQATAMLSTLKELVGIWFNKIKGQYS